MNSRSASRLDADQTGRPTLPTVSALIIASLTRHHWYRTAYVHNCPGCGGVHAHRIDLGVQTTIRSAHCGKVEYVIKAAP